ncbi:MAG: type II toxin-antitoxin system VapC family toxin [Flavobacteriales bacterium]|nr:type II toxin-antitoxin system VapC family toxin [Flavobacteriales bacterium]
MAGPVVLVDTSVLIDYFRRKDKGRALLHKLAEDGCTLKLSVITEFEVYVGATTDQLEYWDQVLEHIEVLPLGSREVRRAASIQAEMKRQRKQAALPDLFIAATALEADLPVATLNKKHFETLPGIRLFPKD